MSLPNPKISLRQKLRQSLSSKRPPSQATSTQSGSGSATAIAGVPASQPAASVVPPISHVTNPSTRGQPLLTQALQHLSQQDRSIIQKYTSSTSVDINEAIKQAITVTNDKRDLCLAERWDCTIAGRHIILREEADKVIKWLNRFKSIGDVASNAAPVHVGLPWAGFRVLLEVATADSSQMATLLVGCETALYMSSRLQVYTDFLQQLPGGLPRNNLEDSVVLFYAHILSFLARAIQVYGTSVMQRISSALGNLNDVNHFEKQGNDLANKVERDASNCSRAASIQDQQLLAQLQQGLQDTLTQLQQIRQLQQSVDRLGLKIDLGRIPYAKGAIFNSIDSVHVLCHPATRLVLLAQIQQWAQQPDGKNIFWLHGAAGAGKSTISWTFAQWLVDHSGTSNIEFGASFFFKRGEGDRGFATRFFPTIVGQLITKIPGLDALISNLVDQDPFIFDKALGEQFRSLLYQPLQDSSLRSINQRVLIVVVDALDECENHRDIETILRLWSHLAQITTVRIRLFLTSRPEEPLRLQFQGMSKDMFEDIVLQEAIPRNTMEHDLLIYLRDAFRETEKRYISRFPSEPTLGVYWPGDDVLQSLVDMAVPLFIVAATVHRFVGDLDFDPNERLMEVLKHGQAGQMEMTYLPVLGYLTATARSVVDRRVLSQEFKIIVGSIICLAEPLSMQGLSQLLNKTTLAIKQRLAPLHSVLRVSHDDHLPIRTVHLSFAEFLLSKDTQHQPFAVDGVATHSMLLTRCLELLSGPRGLHENLCDLSYPGQPRSDLDATLINERISPTVQYACQYWVYHAQNGAFSVENDDKVHVFLRKHFLHWWEALSLLGRITKVIEHVNLLRTLISANNSTQVSSFLEDARRIVLANTYIVNIAPLQIYSSVMLFAPRQSVVKNICGSIPVWVKRCPIPAGAWSQELLKMEGHTHTVKTVAYSPNGKLLASGSEDKTIRLWEIGTGQEVQKLEQHTDSVASVAFSPNGILLASGSYDKTVILWNVDTGSEVQKLEGHMHEVTTVAFSNNGMLLASGSYDGTVALWNVDTGSRLRRLEEHPAQVASVAFSPDDAMLASALSDGTIGIWNVNNGDEVRKIQAHHQRVSSVSFSPTGTLLASGSWDHAVALWNVDTDVKNRHLNDDYKEIRAIPLSPTNAILASTSPDDNVQSLGTAANQEGRIIEGYWGSIFGIAFSSDGFLLASASQDGMVVILDVNTGLEIQRLEGHTDSVKAVAFAPNHTTIASASEDGTLRLWDMKTRQVDWQEQGQFGAVRVVAFSWDGSLLASGSDLGGITIWEVGTMKEVKVLQGHTEEIRVAGFSADNCSLVSFSLDHTIRFWNVNTGQEMRKIRDVPRFVDRVILSPDLSMLAGQLIDQTLEVYDIQRECVRWKVWSGDRKLRYGFRSAAFSSDGSLFAKISHESQIELYDTSTGHLHWRKWLGHTDISDDCQIGFSSDGLLLACWLDNMPTTVFGISNLNDTRNSSSVSSLTCESTLMANQGVLSIIRKQGADSVVKFATITTNFIKDGWIKKNGRSILWLPQEYRSAAKAYCNNVFAFGLHSGLVGVIELDRIK